MHQQKLISKNVLSCPAGQMDFLVNDSRNESTRYLTSNQPRGGVETEKKTGVYLVKYSDKKLREKAGNYRFSFVWCRGRTDI